MSELRCVKKSPSVGRIDGIINRGAPQRRSHKHKGKKDRKGRKEELIKCWIVEFIVHRAASSSIALARPADPSFYFLKKPERKHCLSVSMATNTPLHGSSQKHSVKWQLLLDLLSNKRSLWACLFITTTQTFTRLFTMFRDQRQGGGKKKSPVNYVCAILFLWMCICGSLRRLNELVSTRRLRGHAEEKGRKHCFYISMWTRTRVCAFSLCREKSADIHQETELTIDYQV